MNRLRRRPYLWWHGAGLCEASRVVLTKAHPAVLKHLIEEYESLHAEKVSAHTRQRMEDIAYTLCVSTGTRNVDERCTAAAAAEGRFPADCRLPTAD